MSRLSPKHSVQRLFVAIKRALGLRAGRDSSVEKVVSPSALVLESMRAELRKIAALDRAILDTAADAILVIDSQGIILKANATAHRIFRAKQGELLGRNVSRLMPNPHRDNHDGYIRHHLETGEKRIIGSTRELVATRLDGERFPMELSVASTKLENETLFTGFVRDVSERKKLETRLRQQDKLISIGQLASGVAHEMNTPLQFIRVNTEYMQGAMRRMTGLVSKLLPQEASGSNDDLIKLQGNLLECLNENLDGVSRLVDIVQAMKEFSHPGEQDSSGFDLNQCLLGVTKMTRNHWKHVAELDVHYAPDLPLCAGSRGEISQVMLNLVVNAADAIAEHRGEGSKELGKITAVTRAEGDMLVFEIEDDGPGVPEDILNVIFDPFFTTKPVGKGSGQGLAIAYDLVAVKHGGSLTVENLPTGGCRFAASLPKVDFGGPKQELDSNSHQEGLCEGPLAGVAAEGATI